MNCELLFVYGSLRRGFAAHGLLRRLGARYVGKGSVRGRLFDLGEFPGAVKARGSGAQVMGEVYGLPPPALKSLERYEGARYTREIVEVKLRNGERRQASIYWLKQALASKHQIRGGNYAKRRELF